MRRRTVWIWIGGALLFAACAALPPGDPQAGSAGGPSAAGGKGDDPGQTGDLEPGSCAEGWQPCEGSCAPARAVEATRFPGGHSLQGTAMDDRHFFVLATKLGVSGPEIWAASTDGGEPVRLVSGPIAHLTADPSGLFYQTTS